MTSAPHIRTASTDDHLWKGEDKSELKAGIKITQNLIESPILKEDLEDVEELKELKVGNQGTNFYSSQVEYEAILDLIENEITFQSTRNKFNKNDFDVFIDLLRKVKNELNLKPNDPRIVFSVKGYRLNFIVGQRYCLNLLPWNQGVIWCYFDRKIT
ncbi:MAG: hypothetical protein IPP71_08385 [Bacteroidetes bacterium]|nr:hypothetical protein [Bacteroidota bacterium]